MKNKYFLLVLVILLTSLFLINFNSKAAAIEEKRGNPTYDFIIGEDHLPHYRVFFWVPKDAKHFTPYADEGVKTDVSHHGSVEKWSVIETDKVVGDEKLVFIYVPKTFVFLSGHNFYKAIHLSY